MDYYVEIPPGTALSAFDCILTWNQIPESSTVAHARLSSGIPKVFDRGTLAGTRFVLGSVPPEITSDRLHNLLRLVLERRGVHRPTTMCEVKQADGTVLLQLHLSE
jgi:hypothetical protein